MFQHFLQSCSLPRNWLALITDTTTTYGQNGTPQVRLPIDQHEAIFDSGSQEWLPDCLDQKRRIISTALKENHLEKPSDGFWVTKISFHETQMPKLNTEFFQEMIETGHLEPVPEP